MKSSVVCGLSFLILLSSFVAYGNESSGESAEPVDLKPVVITGSRTAHRLEDSPVPVEVLTKEDIEASGGESVADVLDGQVGVRVQQTFQGASVQLQGLDSKYVLILVDGERVGGRIAGAVDLSRIYVENIERIEIVKGATCALYGSDAMGGVINIITRHSDKPIQGNARITYGSGLLSKSGDPLHAIDVSGGVGIKEDGWNSRFSGGWHSNEAFDLDPETIATTGSAIQQWEVANTTSYSFSKKNKLQGSLSYSQRDQQGIDSNEETGAVYDRRNLIEYLRASFGPEFGVGDTGRMKIQASYHLNRDQYIYDQRRATAQDKDEQSIEHLGELTSQYTALFGESHLVTTGIDTLYQELHTPRLDNGRGSRYRVALFAQDEWTPSEEPVVQVVPGVRADIDSQFGVHVSPKASLRYDPTDTLILRASYGMGYRAPDFKELFLRFENPGANYVVNGNQDLGPETSHAVNASAHYAPTEWMESSVSLFRNDISNLIDAVSLSPGGDGEPQQFSYDNIARAYTQGGDVQFGFHFADHWNLAPGYSFLDTRDKDTGRQLEGRSMHRAFLESGFRHRDWGLRITSRGTWVGPRTYYFPTGQDPEAITRTVTSPHVLLDARISQELGDTISLIVHGENLVDAGNVEDLPIQPRTISLGVSGRF